MSLGNDKIKIDSKLKQVQNNPDESHIALEVNTSLSAAEYKAQIKPQYIPKSLKDGEAISLDSVRDDIIEKFKAFIQKFGGKDGRVTISIEQLYSASGIKMPEALKGHEKDVIYKENLFDFTFFELEKFVTADRKGNKDDFVTKAELDAIKPSDLPKVPPARDTLVIPLK